MTLTAEVLSKYQNPAFVETGTYDGGAVALALSAGFFKVHSIEIDPERYAACRDRFQGDHRVRIYHGDSLDVLPGILSCLKERATLWLDAHPIGRNDVHAKTGRVRWPLVDEVKLILSHSLRRDHTILIDDRSEFDCYGTSDKELETLLLAINPKYMIETCPNRISKVGVLVARLPRSL